MAHEIRSAIYYPSTEIRRQGMMASSLLLWDRLNVIVPESRHPISYQNRDMAQAWELIGGKIPPTEQNKNDAHERIKAMLRRGGMFRQHYFEGIPPDELMELYPAKLSPKTWKLLQQYELTGKELANGDYGFHEQAGTAVMSKIADACAGDAFARVTDRMLAFGLQADPGEALQTDVVHITVDLIDARSVTLKRLIEFRTKEAKTPGGGDYRQWRHNYADSIRAHIETIKNTTDPNQRKEKNRVFREKMNADLELLRREVFGKRVRFALKPAIVSAVVVAGGHILAAPGAIIAGGAALMGMDGGSLAREFASLAREGFAYSEDQRATMAKHPMAYMYELNRF